MFYVSKSLAFKDIYSKLQPDTPYPPIRNTLSSVNNDPYQTLTIEETTEDERK